MIESTKSGAWLRGVEVAVIAAAEGREGSEICPRQEN